jgi:hypothetical protein
MNNNMINSDLTCITSYFRTKNKHGDNFNNWFKNTLSIKCPYVFFVNKESAELVKQYRGNLPTFYVEIEIEDFYTYQFKDKMVTNAKHCPSVELNLIWNEKIFMIQKAFELNPFKSEWFKWIDAGICLYRDVKPPSYLFPRNLDKLNSLPKNKFIFSSTTQQYHRNLVKKKSYYHHVSGTSYLLHGNIINEFVDIYKKYLEKLVDKNNLWTDQVILTHIYNDFPNKFQKLCNGYGEITRYLFS